MQNFRHLIRHCILCLALCITLTACSNSHQPDDLPLMGLQALQTKSPTGLSGTITVYDLAGKVYLTEDLIFTADTIYSPHLSLPKNTTYRLIIVFYYDDDLPIAFLDEDISVGAEASYHFTLSKENIHFSLSEITNANALLSLSEDVSTGILPDLDLDDDGFSNIVEYRGESDPRDDTSIPHGPNFESINVEYAADGNLVTVTVELSDGNYVTDIEPSVANYGYLQRGGIFTEDLSGDDLDRERTYTLSFNPQYAPVGEITLNFSATNSIDLTSTDSVTLNIEDNGENVGPVIVFDSLSTDDVIDGDVEVAMTAYDRDTIVSLDLISPTSITDTASEAAYFVGTWDTGSQDDGAFTVIATSEDFLGETTTRRLAISINNGTDGSGPGLQMSIFNANHTSIEIDFLNGETVFGVAPFRVTANDASDVSYIQLTNLSDLNCDGADLTDCPITNHNDGLDDFITSNSAYSNSFDTTSYNDGDVVTMSYWSGDSHGSDRQRSFSFTIQNAPTINSVATSTTTVRDGGELQITWEVEDRTTAVYVLDAENNTIDCAEGTSTGDGDCTFTPTQSQAYTVRAVYSVENQYDDVQTFYADQATDTVSVDFDDDGVFDESDNCYKTNSTDQTDSDEDGYGDLCDPDVDGDGYADSSFDFTTFYTDYVGSEVTTANQEYATLYTTTTYVGTNDCDDEDTNKNPGQNEKLNTIDDNCDGENNVFDFSDSDAFDFLRDEDGTNILQMTGVSYSDNFGTQAKSIGDVNADGYTDFAVTAVRREGLDGGTPDLSGAIYIFLGPLDFTIGQQAILTQKADLTIYGGYTPTSSYTATSGESILKSYTFSDRLSTVVGGDFDGDGCDDLAMGAKGDSTYKRYGGSVTIVWGCNTELFSVGAAEGISLDDLRTGGDYEGAATTFYRGYAYNFFGASLEVIHLETEQQDQLVVGAPFLSLELKSDADDNPYYGPDDYYELTSYPLNDSTATGTGRKTSQIYLLQGPDSRERCSSGCEFTISTAASTTSTGNFRIIQVTAEEYYDHFGNEIKNVGDIDGDGIYEFAVSAPYTTNGAATQAGAVYVFSNSLFTMPGMNVMTSYSLVSTSSAPVSYSYKIVGTTEDEQLGSAGITSDTYYSGSAITTADLDGDDKQDLIIGAPNYNDGEGKVFVFTGSGIVTVGSSEIDSDRYASKTLTSPDADSDFGSSIIACDVDHDGIDDIFVGAPSYNSDQGAVFGFNGTIFDFSDLDPPIGFTGNTFAEFYGQATYDFGNAMLCADLDVDGQTDDLAIGEWKWADPTTGHTNFGSVYFITTDYE